MIPRKNERTSKRLAGMSPWTWVAASMMAGGLAMMAPPAQADTGLSAPASQASSASTQGPGSVSLVRDGDGFGGFGGFGFGNRRDRKGDEIVDLFSIWQGDD